LGLSDHIRESIRGIGRSANVLRPYSPPISICLAELRNALASGDISAAIKATETVESSFTGVMNDWSRALELSRATLEVI